MADDPLQQMRADLEMALRILDQVPRDRSNLNTVRELARLVVLACAEELDKDDDARRPPR